MKKAINKNKFYILFFVAVSVFAFLFPLSADDLGWATTDGMKLLQNRFADYNGRYLGNISAIALSKFTVLRVFVKSLTLTGILYLIQKMTGNEKKDFLYLSAFLLVIPTSLFTQGFVWTAGFSNYCLSAVVMMLNLYIVFYKTDKKFYHIILLFLLGVSGQLFMETYTIFNIIAAVFSVVYFISKNKKADISSVVYFLSTVIGAVIMFTNGIYGKVAAGEDTYQSFTAENESLFQSVFSLFKNLFSVVLSNALIACFPAMIFIVCFCISKMKKSTDKNKKITVTVYSCFALAAVSAVLAGVIYLLTKDVEKLKLFAGLLFFFILLSCAVMIISFVDKEKQKKIAVYFIMILILTLPLTVVFPVGARCYVGAYILLIMILKELYDFEENHKFSKFIKIASAILLVFNLVGYSIVFASTCRKVDYIRSEAEKGNKVVKVEHTKLRFLVYGLDVEDKAEKFERRFCEYYDLPLDTEIEYK